MARIRSVSLTTKYLEDRGYRVAYVQRSIKKGITSISFDAFGFADFIAFRPGQRGILMVNACAWSDLASHRAKYATNQTLREFLIRPENRFVLIGWKGGKGRERCKVEEWPRITPDDSTPPTPKPGPASDATGQDRGVLTTIGGPWPQPEGVV